MCACGFLPDALSLFGVGGNLVTGGKQSGRIVPNAPKFSEFELQRLEERLETDPLMVDGLLSVARTAIHDTSSFAPLDNEEECTHCSGSVTCNVH